MVKDQKKTGWLVFGNHNMVTRKIQPRFLLQLQRVKPKKKGWNKALIFLERVSHTPRNAV